LPMLIESSLVAQRALSLPSAPAGYGIDGTVPFVADRRSFVGISRFPTTRARLDRRSCQTRSDQSFRCCSNELCARLRRPPPAATKPPGKRSKEVDTTSQSLTGLWLETDVTPALSDKLLRPSWRAVDDGTARVGLQCRSPGQGEIRSSFLDARSLHRMGQRLWVGWQCQI
jgi:hypothetical protein